MASAAPRSIRENPQIVLPLGFWEPSLYLVAAVQVVVPVFFMVTDTAYDWPAVMVVGTLWATNRAFGARGGSTTIVTSSLPDNALSVAIRRNTYVPETEKPA